MYLKFILQYLDLSSIQRTNKQNIPKHIYDLYIINWSYSYKLGIIFAMYYITISKGTYWARPRLYQNNIDPDCLQNVYKTGLYYQNIPNTLYVNKQQMKKCFGCKQMKEKSHKTLIVCTAENGNKVPFAVVGK